MFCFETTQYYLSLYGSNIFHMIALILNAFSPPGHKVLYKKDKIRSRTGPEVSDGTRGIAVLFL
jgi:hypothetical protein